MSGMVLLSVVVVVVVGWQGVAGQSDRGPFNFKPRPVSEGSDPAPPAAPPVRVPNTISAPAPPIISAGSGEDVAESSDNRDPVNFKLPPTAKEGENNRQYAGFSVRKASKNTLVGPNKVRFEDVLLNMGGWSSVHSDFQAPVRGIYYFSFHGVSKQGFDFTLQLMLNNKYQVTAYGSRFDYQQASNSALLNLNLGDMVHLQLQDGTMYEHPGMEAYTTFTGYLLMPVDWY